MTEPSETPVPARSSEAPTIGKRVLQAGNFGLEIVLMVGKYLVLGLLVMLVGTIVWTARTPRNVIDVIAVPKELAERGYTGEIMAQRILDEIQEINRRVKTEKLVMQMSLSSEAFESRLKKVDVPVAGISLAAIISPLRELFGVTDTKIAGEFILDRESTALAGDAKAAPPKFTFRLRITDKGAVYRVRESTAQLDALLRDASAKLVERSEPLIAAVYYKLIDDNDNARRVVQETLTDPSRKDIHLDLLNVRGIIAHAEKRYDDAIADYQEVKKGRPRAVAPYVNLANVYFDQGAYDKVIEEVRAGIPYSDGDSDDKAKLNLTAGVASLQLKKFGDAGKYLKESIQAAPQSSSAYYYLGEVYRDREQPDLDEAVKMLFRAAEYGYSNAVTYVDWGLIVRERGDRAKASQLFEKALATDPKYIPAYFYLGLLRLRESKWDQARELFGKAIDADPDWPAYHHELGVALRGLGKFDEAIEAFERTTRLDPKFALSYAEWGGTLAEVARGTPGEAAAEKSRAAAEKLKMAIEIAPNDAAIRRIVGQAHDILKQPVLAVESYRAALALDEKENEDLRAEIARIEQAVAQH